MTIPERLDNYAKRSMAHQLTFAVANDKRLRGYVREVFYERAANTATRDTGVIVCNTGMTIRLYDITDSTHGYGIGVKDFYDSDAATCSNQHDQRNYYRSAYRELSDAQWRNRVVVDIASDYEHLYALHYVRTVAR